MVGIGIGRSPEVFTAWPAQPDCWMLQLPFGWAGWPRGVLTSEVACGK